MTGPQEGLRPEGDGPRLPAGPTNEFLGIGPLEMAQRLDIYSLHPNTDREYTQHALSSMHALAALEHAAFPTDTAADTSQRRVFVAETVDAEAATERAQIEHRPGDLRYVDLRRTLPSVIAASYAEGLDPETGERYAVMKLQPNIEEPPLEDERLSQEERQRLFMEYMGEAAHPMELFWESQHPGMVRALRDTDPEAIDISRLPVDRLIRTVNFLRRVAIWDALQKANDETQPEQVRQVALVLLEKLQPVTDSTFNEGRFQRRRRGQPGQ